MFSLGFLSVCEFYSGLPMQVMVMRARRNARTAEKFQCSSIQQLLLPGLYQHTSHNLTLLLGNLNKCFVIQTLSSPIIIKVILCQSWMVFLVSASHLYMQ